MLEEIDALPRAERELASDERNAELHLRQSRSDVGGHVVRAFVIMGVGVRILRRDPGEISFEVAPDLLRGILLNEERCGGVAAEQGEKTFIHLLTVHPAQDVVRDLDQALPSRSDLKSSCRLSHGKRIASAPRDRSSEDAQAIAWRS
jgi:hypothetical protein